MKPQVLIIDYGMGNIGSVCNALDWLGSRYFVSGEREALALADGFILPGVGAFGAAMDNLRRLGLIETLTDQVMVRKKPFLGICLGMQLIAQDSVEQGYSTGLGWIKGHVLALEPSDGLRVPHVGWNSVTVETRDALFRRIENGAHFYFDHSFHFRCNEEVVSATFEYGGTFVASIQKENILATQFHPEKSQRSGLKLLRNFLNLVDSNLPSF